MTAVLTIIATVAGVLLYTCLFGFLIIGLTTWFDKHGFDLILNAISWACYFWERRL